MDRRFFFDLYEDGKREIDSGNGFTTDEAIVFAGNRITELEAALKRIVEAKALMSEALGSNKHDEAMEHMKELHAAIKAAAPLIEKVKS